VALVDWLTGERPTKLQRQALLRPICEEGHLPSMHSATEYEQLLRSAGLEPTGFTDLTAQTQRTWTVVAQRLGPVLARDRRLLAALCARASCRSPSRSRASRSRTGPARCASAC
jgi:tocopherol O-methyltransferase